MQRACWLPANASTCTVPAPLVLNPLIVAVCWTVCRRERCTQPQQSGVDKQADDKHWSRYSRALAAAAANPHQQVVQQPTEAIMILYFKKHLQRHMTATGLVGTEHMSLLSACSKMLNTMMEVEPAPPFLINPRCI
jgi:hypothetical protein